jgi:oxygen-independent coproporphyrinogen-3 oxidase
MVDKGLIRKYDVPGPRYTSYPTVPYWDEDTFSVQNWTKELKLLDLDEGISVYIHLPFCESLCTYCGCTTRITKNHTVERTYIDALLKEWNLYIKEIGSIPEVKELHLGGGTPTFFSPKNLKFLLGKLLEKNQGIPSISVEGHPNSTTDEHLEVLYRLGATRLSLGIQDFNEMVQNLIHRIQTLEQVVNVTESARRIGYQSINFDLIYGLPGQNEDTIRETISKTLTMRPDRIAFYSYAHVPWMKPAQKSFESKLPNPSQKRLLYELGKQILTENGYVEIGMDHFALPQDELNIASEEGRLHRNFMGYTTQSTKIALGLGVSAISDLWTGFAQNQKTLESYYQSLETGEFPVHRGHMLNTEDLELRTAILNLMCRHHTDLTNFPTLYDKVRNRLSEMEKDDLIRWDSFVLHITEKGRPFVRNVCMAFDERMFSRKPEEKLFSQTI